jgi:cytochrome c556
MASLQDYNSPSKEDDYSEGSLLNKMTTVDKGCSSPVSSSTSNSTNTSTRSISTSNSMTSHQDIPSSEEDDNSKGSLLNEMTSIEKGASLQVSEELNNFCNDHIDSPQDHPSSKEDDIGYVSLRSQIPTTDKGDLSSVSELNNSHLSSQEEEVDDFDKGGSSSVSEKSIVFSGKMDNPQDIPSSKEYDESKRLLLNEMSDKHSLSFKMRSESALDTSPRTLSTTIGGEKVFHIMHSFGKIENTSTSHFRISHLFDKSKRHIEDSHTSYRRDLDREVTDLKMKLAEAQERADTLQNDFNRVSIDNGVYQARMDEIVENHENTKKRADELGAVVIHLQENAKDASDARRILQGKIDTHEEECQSLAKKNRHLRHENRKLRRNLQDTGKDLEGRGMENQGLKSENAWLKQQLQSNRNGGLGQEDVSSLGESTTDDELMVTGIRELLGAPRRSPSKRKLTKRRSNRMGFHGPGLQEEKISAHQDDHCESSSRTGIFSSFRERSLKFSTSNSVKEISLSAPQMEMDNPQKTAITWNWWSPFGAAENNPTSDQSDGNVSESEHSSEDFVQYLPKSSRGLSYIAQNSAIAFGEASNKVLVPRGLSDRL